MTIEKLAEARKLLHKIYGTELSCDCVTADSVSVDWGEAFSGDSSGRYAEARAQIITPDFSESDLETVLDYIEERDSYDAEEFRRRLSGLDEDEREELAELDKKATSGPVIGQRPGGFDRRLTDEEYERMRELRAKRDEEREEIEDIRDEIDERANELAADNREEFEPMMNYAYPIDLRNAGSWGQCQAALMDVGSVVLVELDGEAVLALSGGGMDLRWEICAAYLTLGCRPPLEFCNLPRMAGRGESEGDLAILAGCMESAEVAARWAENTVEDTKRRILGE